MCQVERLSGMLEMTPERMEKVEDKVRLQVINSTVNIDKRLIKLYELIENDLLGRLQYTVSYIAPYGVRPALSFLMALTCRRMPPHLPASCSRSLPHLAYGICMLCYGSLSTFVCCILKNITQ